MSASKWGLVSLALAGALVSGAASSESKKINNTVYQKSEESVDKQLRLKKVLLFPSVDDVSGVLAPQLDAHLQHLFAGKPRFELIRDPNIIRALGSDDASYLKIAQSERVHQEAARISGADATVVLRTRSVAGMIEMTLDWRDASGKLLYSESSSLPGSSSLDARSAMIANLLNTIVKKIPFIGTVTGRTGQTLTLDLGRDTLSVGDSVDLIRLVSLQRHPLLGVVVSTDYAKVGTARITSVDRVLSFAEIVEESVGETIRPDNKIVAVHARGQSELRQNNTKSEERFKIEKKSDDAETQGLHGDFDQSVPRFGNLYLDLQYGSISYNQSVSSTTTSLSGSGVAVDLGGELWVTKEWILQLDLATLSATPTGTQSGSNPGSGTFSEGNVSRKDIDVAVGYRVFPVGIASSTNLTVSAGYQKISVNASTDTTNGFGNKAYSGIFIRGAAEIALNQNNKVSAGISFQPFAGFTDDAGVIGVPDSATSIGIDFYWGYRLAPNIWARGGIQYESSNGSYQNGNTVADKKFAIGPGITYSF